jgi:AcrR family transcriptional regulator
MDEGRPRYHHGDLRAALLAAAEAELTATGVEGFSLRAVAKRAGVSHAAPAHHFGDTPGLLTALAAEGFGRLLACQTRRERQAPVDPASQVIATGLGYVDFALSHPALFRLMFASDRPDHEAPDLRAAGGAAIGHLAEQMAAAGGTVRHDKIVTPDMAAAWAIVHGLATLIGQGQMASLRDRAPDDRDAVLAGIIARVLPRTPGGADPEPRR